jgi:hypothetical protein
MVKEPLSVSAETIDGEFLVNLKFEIFSDPSPLTTTDVPEVKTVAPAGSSRVAFQFPLTVAGWELLEPHPRKSGPASVTVRRRNVS